MEIVRRLVQRFQPPEHNAPERRRHRRPTPSDICPYADPQEDLICRERPGRTPTAITVGVIGCVGSVKRTPPLAIEYNACPTMRIPKMFRPFALWLAAFGLLTSTIAAAAGYRVIRRISIPGDTGWDYITADSQGRRLYVPHGVEVVVLDLDSANIVGKV